MLESALSGVLAIVIQVNAGAWGIIEGKSGARTALKKTSSRQAKANP